MPDNPEPRASRAYETSSLPTLGERQVPPGSKDVLLALYSETCQTWRALVDVRFKLLALVPSLALALTLTGDERFWAIPSGIRALMALLGLTVTGGLWIYDKRNSELHDELISRARKLESELGVDTGAFLGRPKPRSAWIQHGRATALIHGAALVAGLVALLLALCER